MYQVGNNIVVFDEQGKMVVQLNDPVHIAKAKSLPQVQVEEINGCVMAMLPWHEDACVMLQNIGVDTTLAAPFWKDTHHQVEGKYNPMIHQLYTAAFLTLNPRAYVLSDPRTGKTGSLLLAMDYMQKHGMIIGGVLIITTVTTMPSVWAGSIKKTMPNAKVLIAHGRTRATAPAEPADFYVTNYDSCRLSTQAFVTAVKEQRIGAVVIDELTHVANASSQRHKAIDAVVNKTALRYVIGVTGSPGNNPEAVYGMCRMINRSKLPCQTKTAWMNMVTYQYGPETFMRKPKAEAPSLIHNAMQPAVRFKKEDIIDLPPVVYQDRTYVMSKEQKALREQFKDEAVALVKSGEVITAANAAVVANKLLQVAQGFVLNNDGEPVYLEHQDRINSMLDAIAETNRKVVVFGMYKAGNRKLVEVIKKAGYTVDLVDGSITGQKRAEILDNFQNKKDPHILVAQYITVSFGVELSAADTMIMWSAPVIGGFMYAQVLERLSSTKQTSDKISIIRLIGSPEEQRVYNRLDDGQAAGAVIAGLFEDYSRGILS